LVVNRKQWILGVTPLVVVIGLLAGPSGLGAGVIPIVVGAPTGIQVAPLVGGVSTSLSIGGSVGSHLGSPFWGINTADNYAPASQLALGKFLNSTPITVIRLGGGDDGYNPTTATEYQAPPSGVGRYTAVSELLVNFTWFKAWCYSRTPHCVWMTYLPGEENNTQAAVHAAQYFHNVLHFVPTYWEFGNEPLAWTHYGLNWTVWSTTDADPVTGIGYATMVHNYIAAVLKLFPTDHFMGIQNSCACNPTLLTTLAQVDGPELSGMAYHEYPWLNGSNTSPTQFFGALDSVRAIPNTSAHMELMVAAGCPTCDKIPISLGEYQAGPVPDHSPLSTEYPGAPFIAASIIQALENNISTFTIFNIAWLFNTSNGQIKEQGYLYQRILDNMTMGTDYSVQVNAPGVGGAYALLIKNGSRESLLIVNTNVTRALKLSLLSSVFPIGTIGSYYNYAAYNLLPILHTALLLPSAYTISPEQILLLNNW
jgi:hypothetical protein